MSLTWRCTCSLHLLPVQIDVDCHALAARDGRGQWKRAVEGFFWRMEYVYVNDCSTVLMLVKCRSSAHT